MCVWTLSYPGRKAPRINSASLLKETWQNNTTVQCSFGNLGVWQIVIQYKYNKKKLSSVYEVILAASQTDKDGVDQPQTGSAPRIFPSREGQINLRLYIIYGWFQRLRYKNHVVIITNIPLFAAAFIYIKHNYMFHDTLTYFLSPGLIFRIK